jgi:ADP-ribosylglycohydrolase
LGGGADTMAAIAGALTLAYYKKIRMEMMYQVSQLLTPALWQIMGACNRSFKISFAT